MLVVITEKMCRWKSKHLQKIPATEAAGMALSHYENLFKCDTRLRQGLSLADLYHVFPGGQALQFDVVRSVGKL